MNNFLAIFNAFPAILGAVQAVEAAIPLPQSGQQKLNLVLGAASAAWEVSQVQQQLSKNQMLNAAGAMVNLAVVELNAAGVFHRSNSAITAPVSSK
jgi:hypothetical protein